MLPSEAIPAASLTLDYQNADIQVEDENGQYIKITEIKMQAATPSPPLKSPLTWRTGII